MLVRFHKRGWLYLIAVTLFGIYLLIVINLLFFPIFAPYNWPANLTWKEILNGLSQINLLPFHYARIGLTSASLRNVLYDIVGNILLTVPFGLGFCFLTRLRDKRIFWVALGVGMFLEGTQLLIKLIFGIYFHSVDINDVIFNALGVVGGAGLYLVGSKLTSSVSKVPL